ncbi:MAG: class I SAM-dependent methyltransferase [Nanoarchaeota archaeon]
MTYYDDIAEGYDGLHADEQKRKLSIIQPLIEVRGEDALLDVGCGSGISTRVWACMRTGIDPAEKLISIAREKDPAGTYIVGAAEQLPFADHMFDIVQSLTAIHNFLDHDKAIKEMKRVGRDMFVISVLARSAHYDAIKASIVAHLSVRRILKDDKDVIFIATS